MATTTDKTIEEFKRGFWKLTKDIDGTKPGLADGDLLKYAEEILERFHQ